MTTAAVQARDLRGEMSFREFVALIAAIMAMSALSIDGMLPALKEIGIAVGISTENGRQWIITSYLLGMGVAQLAVGPLSDRFGRRPVLLVGLAGYVIFALAGALATSLNVMMIARILQGASAASPRVLAIAIVRDRYNGSQMARVISLASSVLMAVPIIAPSIGQGILLIAPWRWIFGAFAVFAAVVALWAALRLPETLHHEDITPLSTRNITRAFRIALTNRVAFGYMLAMTLAHGGLFAYINSAQQVFVNVFAAPRLFSLMFGASTGALVLSALFNSRVVRRLGMRRISHAALIGYIGIATVHALIALAGAETLLIFMILQFSMLFCFGLMVSNFNAIGMEPLGHLAGTASSAWGFSTTVGAAIIGFLVGQQFNGTVIPLTLSYVGLGGGALIIIFVTEKGRLLRSAIAPIH